MTDNPTATTATVPSDTWTLIPGPVRTEVRHHHGSNVFFTIGDELATITTDPPGVWWESRITLTVDEIRGAAGDNR